MDNEISTHEAAGMLGTGCASGTVGAVWLHDAARLIVTTYRLALRENGGDVERARYTAGKAFPLIDFETAWKVVADINAWRLVDWNELSSDDNDVSMTRGDELTSHMLFQLFSRLADLIVNELRRRDTVAAKTEKEHSGE